VLRSVKPVPSYISARRSLIKELTYLIKRGGQPYLLSLRISLLYIIILKAPAILSKRRVTTYPSPRASLMSYIKHAIRSIADRLGRALKYYSRRILYLSIRRVILLAKSLLSPFPIQKSREIGLYPLYIIYTFLSFLGLGIIVTSALLNKRGWCLS
jgi:hypothetical protein